jgi:hypothetical protein
VSAPTTWTNVTNGTACGSPSGGSCTSGVCGCPTGQSNCAGFCRATGAACSVGVGACLRTGSVVCSGTSTACSVAAGSPTTETCNNVDDNCDGAIDNGVTQTCYTGPSGTAGIGACRTGTQTCSAGAFGACVGQVVPTTEVCNGVDDDCDGIIDDGFCRIGGICYNNGQVNPGTTCQTCVAAANAPSPTTWTNVTNGTACGAPSGGVCTSGVCGCVAGQSNCSGFCRATGAACSAGVGVCLRNGSIVCSGTTTTCSVTAGAPGTEACNGLDDDCNGTIDNGIVSTCGAPEGLGTLLTGQSASFAQFVAAPAGSERWYVVNFPGGAGGTPTVTISGAGVTSGQIRMEVRTSCAAGALCAPGTQWSFTDNASVAGTGYRTRNVAWPSTMYIRVYRVASTTTCGNFTITATRP